MVFAAQGVQDGFGVTSRTLPRRGLRWQRQRASEAAGARPHRACTTMNPMRVTVFGASGKIGRLVVEALLADGHDIVAYVRSPGKLGLVHDRMTVVPGPLSDGAGIIEAVRGSAAVISALGPSLDRRAKGTPVTDGTRNIVAAMKAVRVRRYVGLATPSVSDPRTAPR